jgi:hypothetical protein
MVNHLCRIKRAVKGRVITLIGPPISRMFIDVFCRDSAYREISRYMNRAALIDQIEQARATLEKLLTLLQSAPVERDRFVSHLYQSRR